MRAFSLDIFHGIMLFGLALMMSGCAARMQASQQVEIVPYACPQIPPVLWGPPGTPENIYEQAMIRQINGDPSIQQTLATQQIHEVLGLELLVNAQGNVMWANMIGCARIRTAQQQIFARVSQMNFGAFPASMAHPRSLFFLPLVPLEVERIEVVNPQMAPPPPPNGPAQFVAAQARWQAAMPAAFVPLWSKAAMQVSQPNALMNIPIGPAKPKPPAVVAFLAPFHAALDKELPSPDNQILALLSWYGSGLGPWSGYPIEEGFAALLLSDYPIAQIIHVITAQPLTSAEAEGAARYLADDIDLHDDVRANQLLPASLKQEFITRALQSGDQDKILRAENAFSA